MIWAYTLVCVVLSSLASTSSAQEAVCDLTDNNGVRCEAESKSACQDTDPACAYLAQRGECQDHLDWMLEYCPRSCSLCGANPTGGEARADDGSDLGIAQRMEDPNVSSAQLGQALNQARNYWNRVSDKLTDEERQNCRNWHEVCAVWAVEGECDRNPFWMKRNCGPVCQSCDYARTVEGRCPLDPTVPNAWEPGDLDKMFRRLSSEPFRTNYNVQVLSSPILDGPWVVTMENVVSDEEAQRFIELGEIEGYKRSTVKPDVHTERQVSQGRTSSNAWCREECYRDEMAQQVIQRISNWTELPELNSEYLQLLKYDPGTFYNRHHDYIPVHRNRQQGVRVLTVYLYLNDVEQGGGTDFPELGLTVLPKRGRALIWPNVLNEDPHTVDERTVHQALLVESGVKYGANAWFHIRDYKTTDRRHCT